MARRDATARAKAARRRGGGYSGDEGSPDGRFPPIAHPRALIGGHQIDTIATPRHYG